MIATAIDSAVAAFDSLAILVTDPAVSGHSPAALQVLVDDRPLTFLGTSAERWERVKRANLDMVFHGLQAVLPP